MTNAVSYERVSEGPRDFIDVVQKPGEAFDTNATVTIRAFALGNAALARITSFRVPDALASGLTPFRHGDVFDPASPLCARIAASSESLSMARTVQNLLNWMRDHMKYADTTNRTLDDILAGGQGVCHQYCSSFTALCRAAGVPARVAHGVVLDAEGEFENNAASHGWASVYLDTVGWVPVDPLDPTSLALFGRSNYLLTDYANETPEDNHFDYRSIQGFHCDGQVLAIGAAGPALGETACGRRVGVRPTHDQHRCRLQLTAGAIPPGLNGHPSPPSPPSPSATAVRRGSCHCVC